MALLLLLLLFLLHLSSYVAYEGVSKNQYIGETLWGRKPVNPCQFIILRYIK
jgi:hypothetical protein